MKPRTGDGLFLALLRDVESLLLHKIEINHQLHNVRPNLEVMV